ncbi:MAG TPA: gephyrin-like molybdotransferase Glp [Burkholderiaceae bacterium]|nr:gephyrin-like molybdotransferase Glp [Burkholderiaceae bacterium]
MLTIDEALQRMLAAARPLAGAEEVPTQDAAGRVLAQAVVALVDVPPLDNAQMDGYAVRCRDIAKIPATLPVRLRVTAGQSPEPLPAAAAARIFTGAPIPEGSDAVVMQEATRAEADGVVVLEAPQPGQWIRRAGSDFARGAAALSAGQALRAQHLGIAASVGVARLSVVRRPRVALFCTGDELAMPGTQAAPGRIYNSNRFVLKGLLESLGCSVRDLGIVPDSLEATCEALASAAADADLILSSGGVSVGEEDHVKAALATLGELQLWQIAMKPGKPLAFGHARGVPFIGLPGNPVSSFVTFVLLVRPYLLRCLGVRDVTPKAVALPADFAYTADRARREFVRARLNGSGGLDLFPNQNASLLSSVAWADGLVDLAAASVVERGQRVRFLSFAELTGPA